MSGSGGPKPGGPGFYPAGVETLTGTLRVNPKGFGFVDNTFVSPFLVPEAKDGQTVSIIRVKSTDRKKQTIGWKAIQLGFDGSINAGNV